MTQVSTQERFKRGAADAGRFFHYIAEFVGFAADDAAAIRESRFIIEKHIPSIVADFYAQLLRFPATRRHFLRKDGSVDQAYLQMRMQHQGNFWRRAASGEYDDDFARYVDYVGRAHTSHGADPHIYIPERYVMGMVGFVQQRVSEALAAELREIDPDLERRAAKAWNALLMVVLELLSRSYNPETEAEAFEPGQAVDDEAVRQLSVDAYERALGIARAIHYREVLVAPVDEIPDGGRKIVRVDQLSIGVFRQQGEWVALHNSCLHRGGPVCEGQLEAGTLTCPWHGYEYELTSGELLLDRSAALPKYPVQVRDGAVYVRVPILVRDEVSVSLDAFAPPAEAAPALKADEFRPAQLKPGQATRLHVDGEPVAVYNVEGVFFATHDHCTHARGPLSEGRLDGKKIICPWHDSCFDVTDGSVLCGPAKKPVKTYRVTVDGEIARVE